MFIYYVYSTLSRCLISENQKTSHPQEGNKEAVFFMREIPHQVRNDKLKYSSDDLKSTDEFEYGGKR